MRQGVIFLFSFLFVLFFSCGNQSKSNDEEIKYGKFTTAELTYFQRARYKKKYGDYFTRTYQMVLDLQENGKFKIGYCNRKIYATGNWSIKNGSILLDSFFEYPSQLYIPSIMLRYTENGHVFYPFIGNYDDKPGIDTTITVLAIGGKEFDGVLTNKYWTKDSTDVNK